MFCVFNLFGEIIRKEIYTLMGKNVLKPIKKNHYQPDLETEILEVKSGTIYIHQDLRAKKF